MENEDLKKNEELKEKYFLDTPNKKIGLGIGLILTSPLIGGILCNIWSLFLQNISLPQYSEEICLVSSILSVIIAGIIFACIGLKEQKYDNK